MNKLKIAALVLLLAWGAVASFVVCIALIDLLQAPAEIPVPEPPAAVEPAADPPREEKEIRFNPYMGRTKHTWVREEFEDEK